MKRTTKNFFTGVIIAIMLITGFMPIRSVAQEKAKRSTADCLASQDFVKIPTTKYLHIDFVVPKSHKTDYAFQISDIKIVGQSDNNRLQAPKELLSDITTELRNDSLIIKLDMRDKKWWTYRTSTQKVNKMIGSLLTIYVSPGILSISSTKQVLRTPLAIDMYRLSSPNLDINLYDCMLSIQGSKLDRLCISNAHTGIFLDQVFSDYFSIKDRPASLYNRTVQTKANPNLKKKMYVFTIVKRRLCKIGTLDITYYNDIKLGKLNDIKVLRKKALNSSAHVDYISTGNVQIEEIKN